MLLGKDLESSASMVIDLEEGERSREREREEDGCVLPPCVLQCVDLCTASGGGGAGRARAAGRGERRLGAWGEKE